MMSLNGSNSMKELVVISGKGGTGKTSILASLAALAGNSVIADCDVDASNLHLVIEHTVKFSEKFSGGKSARIKHGHCSACGKCEELCRFDAVFFDGPGNGIVAKTFRIDPLSCEGCGVCAWFCAENAIEFKDAVNGKLFVSESKYGEFVHARLFPGEENSGKLVTLVRNTAKEIALKNGADYMMVDGSPGIGCTVIASITGADHILAVTEPTLSGRHDLERILGLAAHFSLPVYVAVNKYDINESIAAEIEEFALSKGAENVGRIRYDRSVTDAMVKNMPVVEFADSGVANDIRRLWETLQHKMAITTN